MKKKKKIELFRSSVLFQLKVVLCLRKRAWGKRRPPPPPQCEQSVLTRPPEGSDKGAQAGVSDHQDISRCLTTSDLQTRQRGSQSQQAMSPRGSCGGDLISLIALFGKVPETADGA